MKYLVIVIFCLAGICNLSLLSQTCPPDDSCTTWTSHADTIKLTYFSDVSGLVFYRVQNCNGVVRFIIDSAIAIENGNFLDTFRIYHYDFSTFRNLLELGLMRKITKDSSTIPNCSVDSLITVQFYTAMCGVWVKCSYKVNPTTVICDSGFSPPMPHYFKDGDWWVDHYRWHECGRTCCERTYTICLSSSSSPFFGKNIKIKEINRKRIGSCTLQNQFRDWRTGNLVPCGDDC